MALLMLLPLSLYLLGGAAALYLAFRFVRAFEHRGVDRLELQDLRARVARLEEEVERSVAEVRELDDGLRFTTRLLAERSSSKPTAI